MIIPVRYSYKNYPYSPKATGFSKALAIITSWPMFLLYIPLASIPVSALFSLFLEDPDGAALCVSVVVAILAVRAIKKALMRKIDKIAQDDLMKQLKEQARQKN